jgi:integrase/recombinase XerD
VLRFLRGGERRLFVAEGKGGHQRGMPVSPRFFATMADYLREERPETDTARASPTLQLTASR